MTEEIKETKILTFDGDYQIIYSSDFNIYENKLILRKIAGFELVFEFAKDPAVKDCPMSIKGDDTAKRITITLTNFNNSLGAGTTKMVPLLKTDDGKQIYFSIHAKALNEATSFLKVSLTFYLK
ncbi:MAG: hypothetical protein Q7T03_11200 [Deltaproteobacteria bacterium]|nr:hypothetical protein [Deltaproteobacteria bacterium]